jgi:hypothetical protein
MANNRALAAAFGVLLIGWFALQHTLGMYAAVEVWAAWVDFVLYTLILIFTPAVMWKARWTALGALVVGVITDVWYIVILITAMTWLRVLTFVLVLLFTYFAYRAYREK